MTSCPLLARVVHLLAILLIPFTLFSNNLVVSNISLTGLNSASGYILVQFDISWDNSWRITSSPSNWDAAWVFVKFSANTGPFKHGTLNYVDGTAANDGHTEPSGSSISTTNDSKGIFIHRSNSGSGSNSWTGVQLRWNYNTDGVLLSDVLEVKVYAMEMVHIPQGTFAAGSGGAGVSEFTLTTINTGTATTAPSGSGSLGGEAGGYPTGQTAPDGATWPNGYHAFYCMKYEISEEQWVNFFNALTSAQQVNLDLTGSPGKSSDAVVNRNTISWSSGDGITAAADRACNFMDHTYLLAYLDWSGLRPLTEMEYEKACRGINIPVANEYAWGTTSIHASAYTVVNDGTANASISNVNGNADTGNAAYSGTVSGFDGALRCGIFPASASALRTNTGGSFYGIMEMTGNLIEPMITIGTSEGRSFTGNHGDGTLTAAGAADVTGWPTVVTGFAHRGGSWGISSSHIRVGTRLYIGIGPALEHRGVRGGRTSP